MKNIAGQKYRPIQERKSSKFGLLGVVDSRNELEKKWPALSYYDNLSRNEIYTTCLDKFQHDQLARPIINLIVNAIFNEPPDIQGDEVIVKRVNQIIEASNIDWVKWGADLEVHGDIFLRGFLGEVPPQIVSIPASSITVDYDETNILNIRKYIQFKDLPEETSVNAENISHLKINSTSNMIYGSSTLRPILWWLDVLDMLWEGHWIRGGQYYGAPIVVITGVPSEHQVDVQAALERNQRPGKNWIFSPDVKVETLDFTKNYPIELLIDRVYQYILAACSVPQHLVYETDSSRGVAMFSGDSFDFLIKSRRRVWELGLKRIFRYILQEEGIWKDDSKLSFGWQPVFQRDLRDQATVLKVAMENGVYSKRTAREILGVDHSEELDRIKQQKKDEPDEIPDLQKSMAPTSKTPPSK